VAAFSCCDFRVTQGYFTLLCLVCDDHSLVCEALSETLKRLIPDVQILLARDYPSAWLHAEVMPDLCICDLMMPGADPLVGIRQLQVIEPSMKIIVLTAMDDDDLMWSLLQSGICAFVGKAESGRILQSVIHLVLAGGRYLPDRLLHLFEKKGGGKIEAREPNASISVTPQQSRVLELISKGQTNKEMARTLRVAPSTVKFHIDILLRRFEARNRTEILSKAIDAGLLAERI
jgi:DNA-binding NarL/FixJ family response regulator